MKKIMLDEHSGAVTFEFIIVLAIFAVTIFASLNTKFDGQHTLLDVIHQQVAEVTNYITNNNSPQNNVWVG